MEKQQSRGRTDADNGFQFKESNNTSTNYCSQKLIFSSARSIETLREQIVHSACNWSLWLHLHYAAVSFIQWIRWYGFRASLKGTSTGYTDVSANSKPSGNHCQTVEKPTCYAHWNFSHLSTHTQTHFLGFHFICRPNTMTPKVFFFSPDLILFPFSFARMMCFLGISLKSSLHSQHATHMLPLPLLFLHAFSSLSLSSTLVLPLPHTFSRPPPILLFPL